MISKIAYSVSILLILAARISLAITPTTPPEAPIDLICVSELPTTSFFVKQNDDQVDVQVYHHNGVKNAPFRNTLITANDIPVLQNQASVIEKLGDDWHIKWKRSGCNADSPLFFQCVGGAQDFEANGLKIHPFALSVSENSQKTIWGDYQSKTVTLDFQIANDPQNYEIMMTYAPSDCVESAKAKNIVRFQPILKK